MQYEIIILELLSRIKKLEDDVKELKQSGNITSATSAYSNDDNTEDENSHQTAGVSARAPYNKTTAEMIDICYKYGKKFSEGDNAEELADEIVSATGMTKSTAIIYLYAVQNLLNGTVYKRGINNKALKTYFDTILNEYGTVGLKKALHATRLHIAYRKKYNLAFASIEKICNNYEKIL